MLPLQLATRMRLDGGKFHHNGHNRTYILPRQREKMALRSIVEGMLETLLGFASGGKERGGNQTYARSITHLGPLNIPIATN